MEIFNSYSLLQLIFVFSAAFIIGLSKAGLKGIDILNVTLMALVFGGKSSTGVVLPLLCVADIGAVIYYHRHAQWNHFWKLLPWIAIGILIGVYTGREMNEPVFRKIMALIIFLTVVIMIFFEFKKSTSIPNNIIFTSSTGIATGITTMLGNLAGAFSNIYFLAMRIPKNNFIGTAAWVFLVVNFSKLPFQFFYWHNINKESLTTDLVLLPVLFIGFIAGIRIVKIIKDDHFRKIAIFLTLIGAIVMALK